MTPQRIQLSRKKGFDLQAISRALNGLPAVVVSRPSKWGNPFLAGNSSDEIFGVPDAATAVHRYALWLDGADAGAELLLGFRNYRRWILAHLPLLRGANLACWCPLDQPCHADVLLELANGPETAHREAPYR